MVGNGALFGKVDKTGKISDDDAAFFYPGFGVAIVGKFEQNVLKSGRAAKVKSEKCQNGMKVVEFFEPVIDDFIFQNDFSNLFNLNFHKLGLT